MGDVNLEIKLNNIDERVIKIEESGGGSGGDDYITSVSNDFNVVNKKLLLSNDVITKLSKVDDKIDKPASATDGQVLTYNGTSNEWEAQAPKGGSITEPTNLEKGIIGGDEWTAKSYTKGSTVIYNNKIYSCIADCGASNLPTDTTYWEETSISKLKGDINEVNSSLGVDITNEFVVDSNCKYFKATYYPEDSIVNIKAFSNNISVANGYTIATPSIIHVAKENTYNVLKGFRIVGGNISSRDLCLLNPLNFKLYGTSDGNTTSFQIEFDYFVN